MLLLFLVIFLVVLVVWAFGAGTSRYAWGSPAPIGGLLAVLVILFVILLLTGNLTL